MEKEFTKREKHLIRVIKQMVRALDALLDKWYADMYFTQKEEDRVARAVLAWKKYKEKWGEV